MLSLFPDQLSSKRSEGLNLSKQLSRKNTVRTIRQWNRTTTLKQSCVLFDDLKKDIVALNTTY